MFGGFILHFLLSNYLTVLLRPRYEEPVDTAADLIKRNITPIYPPGGFIYKQLFATFSDPDYQELGRRLTLTKDILEYFEMRHKVQSTGLYAQMGQLPYAWEWEFKDWYRSSEAIPGINPYNGHLTNKKWPLKEVL